jgi:glycosyltransferase involved in cell wall biosynthesis
VRERLSVVIITRNEEKEIEGCLASVDWADEIVLVDSHSTDKTVEIARRFNANVETRAFTGFTEQKQYATELAAGPWILNIDADERVSDGLKVEIQTLLESPPPNKGYRLPRLTWYLGKFIRHGGWYPDWKLRLFRKGDGIWKGGQVHERIQLNGPVGTLKNPLLHYSFRTLSDHIATIDHFTRLGAEDLIEKRKGGSLADLLFRPPATFLKYYLLRLGFLDGWRGFVIASLSAAHTLAKYARVRQNRDEVRKSGNSRG